MEDIVIFVVAWFTYYNVQIITIIIIIDTVILFAIIVVHSLNK